MQYNSYIISHTDHSKGGFLNKIMNSSLMKCFWYSPKESTPQTTFNCTVTYTVNVVDSILDSIFVWGYL